MKVRIAVYGTLRKFHERHQHFLRDATYLGNQWIPDYGIKKDGILPMAFYCEGFEVLTEVYETTLDTLNKIDELEGLKSGWYERRNVKTKFGSAFMYALRVSKMVAKQDMWYPEGNWIGYGTPTNLWLGFEKERDIRKQFLLEAAGRKRHAEIMGVHKLEPGELACAISNKQNSGCVLSDDEVVEAIEKAAELAADRALFVGPIEPKKPTHHERMGFMRSSLSQFKTTMKVVEL